MAFIVESDTGSETPIEAAPSLPHEEIVGNARLPTMHEEVLIGRIGEHGARPLKDSTRAIIEAAKAKIAGSAPTAPARPMPAATGDGTPTPAATTPPPAAPPGELAKPAEVAPIADPATIAPHADTVRANRLAEHNARLVAEVETLRRSPPAAGDDAKALKELDALYTTNPLHAVRKHLARVLGVAEDSKDLVPHLRFLESDLTQDRIGVPLTEDSERDRKAARTLVAIQREMRERKAEETKTDPAPSNGEAESVAFVGNRIAATKHAETYPLLTAWGEHVHGAKPAELVLRVMRHGVDIGEFDRNEPVDQLIARASQSLEANYQDLLARAPKAPSQSTATIPASTTAPPEAPKGDPSGQRVPSLTSATTSAAPATMPGTTPKQEPHRNERERRLAIIRGYAAPPRTV